MAKRMFRTCIWFEAGGYSEWSEVFTVKAKNPEKAVAKTARMYDAGLEIAEWEEELVIQVDDGGDLTLYDVAGRMSKKDKPKYEAYFSLAEPYKTSPLAGGESEDGLGVVFIGYGED